MNEPIEMPWKPKTIQQQGLQTEALIAKRKGARLHPRSGAGKIKDDMSTDDLVIESKEAGRSHTLKAADLDTLFRRAVRQGKDAEYIIYFRDEDLTATIRLTRGKG